MNVCFFCGVSDGTARGSDVQARCNGCWSHEPCTKCHERMSKGCILISVRDGQEGEQDPYRTGGWIVITDETIRRLIISRELLNDVLWKRMAFLGDSKWDAMGLPRREKQRRRRYD